MSAYIRILLRYAVGALVLKGIIGTDLGGLIAGDPNVIALIEVGVGAATAAVVERYYVLAKKHGWPT